MFFYQVLSSLFRTFFAVLFKRIGQIRYYCFSVLRLRRVAACPARALVLLSMILPLVSYLYSAQQAPQSNSGAYSCDPLRRVPLFERFMYGHANGTAAQLTAQRKKFFRNILRERFKHNLEKIKNSGLLPQDQEKLRGFFVKQEIRGRNGSEVCALSPILASESLYSIAVKIWQNSFSCVQSLTWCEYWVRSLAFSLDGMLLASGSFDESIKIWQRNSDNSFSCLQTLTGHEDRVKTLAFSPDGMLLASGSFDNNIKIWQRNPDNSFFCLQTLTGHKDWVRDLAFSSDGTLLVSGSFDVNIKIWQRNSDDSFFCIQTLTRYKNSVLSLGYSPDGTLLATGSFDKSINIWKRNSNNSFFCIQKLFGLESWPRALAISSDGLLLIAGSFDENIKIWMCDDQEKYALSLSVKIENSLVSFLSLHFLPNSHTMVVHIKQSIILCGFYASLQPQELDLLIKIYSDKNLIRQNHDTFFNRLSELEKITLSQIPQAALPDFFLRYYAREGQEAQLTDNIARLTLLPTF